MAEEYVINEEVKVAPKGIDRLCLQTLDCVDEAKKINQENRDRMVLEQKRFTANTTVVGTTTSAVVVGAIVLALGEALIVAAEAIYTGKLDPTKINETVEFISEKINNSPVVGATISYFVQNADKIQNKNPKEIFDLIKKFK